MKSIFIGLPILAGVILIGILAYNYLPRLDRQINLEAIKICGQISRYTTKPSENDTVFYPVADVYNACLKDAGVKK